MISRGPAASMFGAPAVVIFGGEPLSLRLVTGTALTVVGIVVLTME